MMDEEATIPQRDLWQVLVDDSKGWVGAKAGVPSIAVEPE